MYMESTVERILHLAKEKGVKQSFINDLIGGYRGKVTEWKKGKSSPTKEEIHVIAEFFGVTDEYLIGVDEQENIATENDFLKEIADLTDEELEDVKKYIEFLKSKR